MARVAQKLKANPTRKEWQRYIDEINASISKMPFNTAKQKEKRAKLSAASNYLFNFKEAWRNPRCTPKRPTRTSRRKKCLQAPKPL